MGHTRHEVSSIVKEKTILKFQFLYFRSGNVKEAAWRGQITTVEVPLCFVESGGSEFVLGQREFKKSQLTV